MPLCSGRRPRKWTSLASRWTPPDTCILKRPQKTRKITRVARLRAIQRQVLAAAGRVKWLLVLVLLIGGDWAADDSGRPASASLDQLGKDSDCDAGPKVQRHEAGAERAMRVRSGLRVMTLRQAIRDERTGGDFLASMSVLEFSIFQKRYSRYLRSRVNSLKRVGANSRATV